MHSLAHTENSSRLRHWSRGLKWGKRGDAARKQRSKPWPRLAALILLLPASRETLLAIAGSTAVVPWLSSSTLRALSQPGGSAQFLPPSSVPCSTHRAAGIVRLALRDICIVSRTGSSLRTAAPWTNRPDDYHFLAIRAAFHGVYYPFLLPSPSFRLRPPVFTFLAMTATAWPPHET